MKKFFALLLALLLMLSFCACSQDAVSETPSEPAEEILPTAEESETPAEEKVPDEAPYIDETDDFAMTGEIEYADEGEEMMAPTFSNMNTNLFDCMVEFGGDIFQLPITMENFIDNEWTLINGDTLVQPGEMVNRVLHMEKENYLVAFDVMNFTDEPLPASECLVVCVCDFNLYGDTMPELILANHIRIDMEQAELEKALPESYVKEDKGKFTQYTVSDPERQIYLLMSVDNATGLVDDIQFRVLKPQY